jgi:hypothetical protein
MFQKSIRGVTIAVSTLAVLTGISAVSEAGEATFGYVNPKTGAFRSVTAKPAAAEAAVLTGTVRFTINVKIATGVPAAHVPVCTFRLNEFATSYEYFEDLTVKATRSGSTAVCKGAITYYWPNVTAGSMANYSVTVDSNTTPSSTGVVSFERISTKDMGASLTLPANGGAVSVTDTITY